MVVRTLGPGKFYGKSLPRPRIYEEVKLNDRRVDPPVPVFDALMSWAEEAHWSMGGLSFKRHRLQGRIEGNISKLREAAEEEKVHHRNKSSPSPPPAPLALKRKRRLICEAQDDDDADDESSRGRLPVRKLGDDFDRIAQQSDARTRAQKAADMGIEKGGKKRRFSKI
ncbi:unnamed protein product [Cuscuta epithymum]|uniref:Uncharacterized protein n=1 Tax=Cuscuta epithymum TaxID=186058 RepID=A0AAV0FW53_9ASTE|nr:unnamed protein product [Cuscuta epithymum]CAH9139543.1 unnamed protein product [Cuscuta epithymum]